MQRYIGSKILFAMAMCRGDFVAYRYPDQQPNPDAGDLADEGYLVEYTDGGAPNHPAHEGYISWSPKAQFDAAYLPIGDVDGYQPHQVRVIAEKAQLDDKIAKLDAFTKTPAFKSLTALDDELLTTQLSCMREYSSILARRIHGF